DVDGTVAYVAPISFGTPDPRYPPFFRTVGPDWCRNKVVALAQAMLNHRSAMESSAADQANQKALSYGRISLGPAAESASAGVAGFEWAFWQYWGVDHCGKLPEVDAGDSALFAILDKVSPIGECSDQRLGNMEAYYYQTYNQLGYPDYTVSYLDLQYNDVDYEG